MNINIHGHRGARGRRPENTLAAIEYALQQGVDGVEVDLCVTADDEIVLHHDLRLNPATTRDANGNWLNANANLPIHNLRLNSLRQYDVGRLKPGTDYAREFPRQTPVDGARVPTLEEFVELIRRCGKPDTVFNLELKGNPPRPASASMRKRTQYDALEPARYIPLLLNKLEQLRLSEHVFLQSFDWRLIHALKQRRPDWKTGLLTDLPDAPAHIHLAHNPPKSIPAADWRRCYASLPEMVAKNGGDVWSCHHRHLSEALVREAHDFGLEVYAWTVNEEQDIKRMVGLGVDVIITDYPERCRGLVYGTGR